VRFNTELLSVVRRDDHVEALIRDRASGIEQKVRAAYLIAADGANGTAREQLGIGRNGAGVLQHWMNILFETDLPSTVQGKRFTSFFVTELNATFTPRENGRWLLALQYYPDRGERPESFNAERCRELVRAGAGRSDVKADLVEARSWEVAAYLADRFREGRAFLVGDAAHVMPPTGAFGGNTGIHDAHNLAWKLALVLKGAADPALLDTYDSERRPVALHSLEQALARLQVWFKDSSGRLPKPVAMVDGYDVVFGQRYRRGVLVPEEAQDSDRPFESARELGRPGTRCPHLIIEREGRHIPISDLFGRGFVLLIGPEGDTWSAAVDQLTGATIFPFKSCRIDSAEVFGVTNSGAVLVRPDHFIAWRAKAASADPKATLLDVFARLGFQ
jgi:hypothetical protein